MSTPVSPPGWYPDSRGTVRWWDGYQWTEHTQAPAAPTAQPVAPVAVTRVPPGTPVYTRWIWWIVLLPFLVVIPMFAYLIDLQSKMSALLSQIGSTTDLTTGGDSAVFRQLMDQQLSVILNPWYLALVLVGWGSAAIVIWFSYLDRRDLISLGYVRPFHWAWCFLSPPLVYVIGRTVVVRRQAGRGSAPMWVLIGLEVALVIAAIVWSVIFTASLTQQLVMLVPTTVG